MKSPVASALRIFRLNESKHFSDPVQNCWYDSGDYVVFVQRNLQSLYYLSLAYKVASHQDVRQDLLSVIRPQLVCIDRMLELGLKQFRDQESHGVIVPPLISDIFSPRATYRFDAMEGRDAYILRALIAKNLGDVVRDEWLVKANNLKDLTKSTHCCEEGTVALSSDDLVGIENLMGVASSSPPYAWSNSFANLAALEQQKFDRIQLLLPAVQKEWKDGPGPFAYLGGNYDIAGTVALERLYERGSGDRTFRALSDSLFGYLYGKNAQQTDFTNSRYIHHPCGTWWGACMLTDTLVNGVDESKAFDISRSDAWRLTEVQLVGQAKYILTKVLYQDL